MRATEQDQTQAALREVYRLIEQAQEMGALTPCMRAMRAVIVEVVGVVEIGQPMLHQPCYTRLDGEASTALCGMTDVLLTGDRGRVTCWHCIRRMA